MRPMRLAHSLLGVLLVVLTAACSSPGSSDGGDNSQAAQASEPAASSGGGGGNSGANGSATYELTGDVTASGSLDFPFVAGGLSGFADGGWVAYFTSDTNSDLLIEINSTPGSSALIFSNGSVLVTATEDQGCTFEYSRNDSGGLKGTIDCASVLGSNTTTGALLQHVKLHVEVDAHT
jgi:hypothetical protein